MKKPVKKNESHAAAIGAGALAAAALVAAGGYVLWDKMGKQKQEKVKSWVAKARKEAIKNIGHAKKIGEAEYDHIVDVAVKRYGSMQGINKEELAKVADDLKAEWVRIKKHAIEMSKEAKESGKKVIKTSGKAAKKPATAKRKAVQK